MSSPPATVRLASAWDLWPDPPHRWQPEALAAVDSYLKRETPDGSRRMAALVVAPTGTGKSRLQVAVIWRVLETLRPGWHIVVTVPKISLVEQLVRELSERLGALRVAAYYGRGRAVAPVIVCCQASLTHLTDVLIRDGLRIALWMADEAHRADAPLVWQCIERLNPWARVGLTATPFRAQAERPLRGWDIVAYRYDLPTAMREGVLVPWVPVYASADEGRMDVVDAAISMIRRAAPPGPGLVSAKDTHDAERIAAALTAAGIPAIAIHSRVKGGQDEVMRRRAALMAGTYRCAVHVDVLTEGVDIPGLRWLCPIAERSSDVAIVQELGRGLRVLRKPDQWGPKKEFMVLVPRPTGSYGIVEALGRGEHLDVYRNARELEARAEDELLALRTDIKPPAPPPPAIPRAQAAAEVGTWIRALVEGVRAAGVSVPPTSLPDEARQAPIDAGQAAKLADFGAKGKHPKSYLPEPHREAVGAACLAPGGLTAGQADALIRVLGALRRAAGIHNAAYKGHPNPLVRYWHGVRSLPGEPPALALRSLATHGDRP
jgi:superfamily II DNA or RNA helicase